MKEINCYTEKNQTLMRERGVSFEDIVFSIQHREVLDDFPHPNKDKYPTQRVFVVTLEDYAYLVPYVENEIEFFLKTIIPTRKATKKYLGGVK